MAFYDANAEVYLNDGAAIDPDQVEDVIAAYLRENPDAQLYAVLGVGSVMPGYLAISGAVTIVLLLFGIMIFNKVEKTFMDTV